MERTSSTNRANNRKSSSGSKKCDQNNIFLLKNKILTDLTRAIQLVQKSALSENNGQPLVMTNSEYCVHELCQQFDNMFLFGLKKVNEGYWKLVIEYTHKNFVIDLKRLLNIKTPLGLGRAWIYHALNDNLMESYLKCLIENKKSVLKHYLKEQTVFLDEQTTSILATLIAGLENVQFKLFNDVPYLDHSCWPTHFNMKRQVVDSILNASPGTIANLNSSFQRKNEAENSDSNARASVTSNYIITRKLNKNRKNSFLGSSVNSKSHINNISFDDFSEISNNNQENDTMSTCGSESGRYTATDNTTSPVISNSENTDQVDNDEGCAFDSKNDDKSEDTLLTINRTNSMTSIDYEDEIDKLRQEIMNQKLPQSKLKHSYTESSLKNIITPKVKVKLHNSSVLSNPDQRLADSSLTISKSFDIKIKHLENSLKTIENATSNMDAYVKGMTSVYQDDDDKLCNESQEDEDFFVDEKQKTIVKETIEEQNVNDPLIESVYDTEDLISKSDDLSVKNEKNSSFEEDVSSVNSINKDIEESTSLKEAPILKSSLVDLNDAIVLTEFQLNKNIEPKQEIRVDNNTKLMIMIEIFTQGEDEKLVKFYHATRGHNQGEIEPIYLLISSYGLYILVKNETTDENNQATIESNKKFKKERFINHKQIDYIEVSLEAQAVHLVCANKRQSCWLTLASRTLTENFLENLQIAREMNPAIKPVNLSVFREATQQKLSIKKFIANEENTNLSEVEIKCYSLVFWEDEASMAEFLIHKEGTLWFLNKNSTTNEWKKAYFVLKNDVLTKYRNSTDKRPIQVIKLNGEDFAGCRRNPTSSKPNTIELILSNSNTIYLSSKTATEASDWLQCFCKIISLGNLHEQISDSCLPCCSIITSSRCYFCHEDFNSGFYRSLEVIKFEEINRISIDNENPHFCILHDDADNQKRRHWFVYFTDEFERNIYISKFKESWDKVFEVSLPIEKCQNNETLERCLKNIQFLHKEWTGVVKE